MNRAEKAVEQAKLDREKAVLKELQEHYEYALNSINERLRVLQAAPETQSNVYHIQYQKTMQKQVSDILANLRANEYSTIDQYMHDAYTTGYVGTMYSLHNQNMPLTIPINQDAVLRSVQHNTKLTSPLYDELGIDTRKMQKSINRELSRGLSSGLTYDEIARNIRNTTKAPLARAKLIARTEGHRIHEESSYDAAVAAKAEGADLVKQWDATMDGDTRPNHKQLDTQIRELEEPFEVGTFKPMHPGDFGTAGEDCNCRCVSLKRARWALDEDELAELKKRAAHFGLDKSDEFADFEKKYLKASEEAEKTSVQSEASTFVPAKTKQEAEEYAKRFAQTVSYDGVSLTNANAINERLTELQRKYPIAELEEISVGSKGAMSANYRKLGIGRNKLGKALTDSEKAFRQTQDGYRESLQTIRGRFAGKKMPFSVEKSVRDLENGLRFSRWGVSTSYPDPVKGTVTHEYGHILSDQLFGLVNGDAANPKMKTDWSYRAKKDKWRTIYDRAHKDGDVYAVSQYGAKNMSEFFAECFTAREYGETLPDYIEEFFVEVLPNGSM